MKKKKNYMRSEADGIYIIISFSRDSFCRIKLQLIFHFPKKKKKIYEIITDRPVTIWARALPNHS